MLCAELFSIFPPQRTKETHEDTHLRELEPLVRDDRARGARRTHLRAYALDGVVESAAQRDVGTHLVGVAVLVSGAIGGRRARLRFYDYFSIVNSSLLTRLH